MPSLFSSAPSNSNNLAPAGLSNLPQASGRPDSLRRHLSTLSPHAFIGANSASGTPRISPAGSRQPSPVLPSADQFAGSSANSVPNRLRSGSLTLSMPSSSIADAFGPGVFSGAWTPSLEELKSIHSNESVGGDESSAGGGQHVKTLDYLGLTGPASPPPPGAASPSAEDLKRQPSLDAQMWTLQNHGSPGRFRSNTVASPASGSASNAELQAIRRRQSSSHLLMLAALPETSQSQIPSLELESMQLEDDEASQPDGRLYYSSSADNVALLAGNSSLGLMPATLSHRPRAQTVSLFDANASPGSAMRRRAGTASGIPPSAYQDRGYAARYESEQLDNSSSSSEEAMPGYSAGLGMRSSNSGGSSQQSQQPTRSLYIGNVTANISVQDVINQFGIYGNLESVRVLPEKVHSSFACRPHTSLM